MSVPAAYIGMILIWSTTPLAIKWSSEGVGFLFGISARMLIGAVLCLILLTALRVPFVWNRRARWTYLASGLGLYFAMMSVYWGAQYIASGLVSVVYGLLPMVTGLLAAFWLNEPFWKPAKLIGIALGFFGLLVIFDPSVELDLATLLGVSGVLMSVLLHSISMIWVKRIGADIPALAVTNGGLWVAVPLYLLTWVLFGQWPEEISVKAAGSILYLGVMGSVVGFVLFYYALKHTAASAMAIITVITPVLALTWGVLFNQEPLQNQVVIGAGLILSGLVIHHWGGALFKS